MFLSPHSHDGGQPPIVSQIDPIAAGIGNDSIYEVGRGRGHGLNGNIPYESVLYAGSVEGTVVGNIFEQRRLARDGPHAPLTRRSHSLAAHVLARVISKSPVWGDRSLLSGSAVAT